MNKRIEIDLNNDGIVVFDCETTIFNSGNPFDLRNKLCLCSCYTPSLGFENIPVEYDSTPYSDSIARIKEKLESASIVVAFNAKFDIHWIYNYVPDLVLSGFVWDTQLAEYLLSAQNFIYPSLNEVALSYNLPSKLDIVVDQYWNLGIDTPNVPYDTLTEYAEQDVRLTYEIYKRQLERFRDGEKDLYQLFRLQSEDLKHLCKAERNGLLYNVAESNSKGISTIGEIANIDDSLRKLYPDPNLNFGSSDHVSIILYGGRLYYQAKKPHVYKLKSGEEKIRERYEWVYNEYPSQIKPDPRQETAQTKKYKTDDEFKAVNEAREAERQKPFTRIYSVGENNLRLASAKGVAKKTIELLLKRNELKKLVSTYYEGIPNKIKEMNWFPGFVHGKFNLCGTRTGRLSSSEPNLQNFAKEMKSLFLSRYT